MKTIIAGGRDYRLTKKDREELIFIHKSYQFTEVISGGAIGVDTEGEIFAEAANIPVKRFPANWSLGKSAGMIRNLQMAEYADAVVLFKGGKGTQNMYECANKLGLIIFDLRE